jgi:asparagine N-glycosylation enzyme membrane subunit Stt3
MNFNEWFKQIKWKHVFILILIFLTAFAFRTHILRHDIMFGFDSYWHARMNGELIQTGEFPNADLQGTYHNADKIFEFPKFSVLFWGAGALAYNVATFGGGYDQETWINIVRLLPALYGALTALAIYLLFRYAYKSKKVGYIAGFITAVLPGYVYRTMGGFYEEDSLGFLWMALGIAFLIRALREPQFTKQNIIYASLSGLMFGIMAFTWKVFVIVPVIIEAYFIFTLGWNLIKKVDPEKIKAFIGLFVIIFGITAVMATFATGTDWVDYQVNYAKGFIGAEGGTNVESTGAGVGEENTGKQFFGTKFGVFNIFIFLGIIAAIYALSRKKNDFVTLVLLFWGIGTFYLAWNKLKATYWYGLGLSVLAALTFAELKIYLDGKKEVGLKVASVALGILILSGGVASGVIFIHNHAPSIDTSAGWKDSLTFMEEKLPEGAKMFNWWNWGHWITFMGHKKASTDNTNGDSQANRDFANFVITNETDAALGTMKAYDTDYVILSLEDVTTQQVYSMYAYQTGQNDYRVSGRFGAASGCRKEVNQISGQSTYKCGGNNFNEQQMNAFATTWQSEPNEIYQGRMPIYYYTNPSKTRWYALNNLNNGSISTRLWFDDKFLREYFTLVYNNEFQKIWKINKEAYDDIEPYMIDMNSEEIEEWNSKLWWLEDNNSNEASE